MKKLMLCVAVAGTLAGVSCQPPATPPPATPAPAAAAPTEVGRYQVIVSNEGSQGAVLFLLDTRDGGTWIYRPPTPPAFNGFWSDIPRLTYPPETWQQVFQAMVQQAQAAQAQPPAANAATRPPGAR